MHRSSSPLPVRTLVVCDHRTAPPGTSASWAVTRNWSPLRRIVPVSTASTSALVSTSRSPGSVPKREAVRLDRTRSDSSPASDVESASERLFVGNDEAELLRDRLAEASGKDVTLSRRVDPAVVGGIVLRIGDNLIDASVRGRLDGLRLALRQARIVPGGSA